MQKQTHVYKNKEMVHIIYTNYFLIIIYLIIINFKKEWKGEFCETVITETNEGIKKTQCECRTLNPTTVIADVENIFQNSQINEVFSEKGIT